MNGITGSALDSAHGRGRAGAESAIVRGGGGVGRRGEAAQCVANGLQLPQWFGKGARLSQAGLCTAPIPHRSKWRVASTRAHPPLSSQAASGLRPRRPRTDRGRHRQRCGKRAAGSRAARAVACLCEVYILWTRSHHFLLLSSIPALSAVPDPRVPAPSPLPARTCHRSTKLPSRSPITRTLHQLHISCESLQDV